MSCDCPGHLPTDLSRRAFLARAGAGVGSLALASLLDPRLLALEPAASSKAWCGVVQPLHHAPRCKRVIYLYMAGGMSHLETFDHKPQLAAMHGQPMPESLTRGQQIAQLQGAQLKCFAPQHPFQRFGRSGQEISALFEKELGSAKTDSPEELTMIARRFLRRHYLKADMGISGGNFIIAETGMISITENEIRSRRTWASFAHLSCH